MCIGTLIATSLAISGCSNESRLKDILARTLPPSAQISMIETCSENLGAAVGLFSDISQASDESILNHRVDGLWTRSASLSEFAKSDTERYQGAGVGATILDGKDCLREISNKAEEILFETKTGLYFRSENRKIVVVMFDEPKGHGVIFLQAP